MSEEINHYYIWIYRDGDYHYDRTFPELKYAEERIKELKDKGVEATYTRNELLRRYFY